MTLAEKLDSLPSQPGVYRFYGETGDLLYVGKAKKLRNRVRSYFQESKHHDGRIRIMISKIRDLQIIVTDSEAEALMLENTLIKAHQPRYNIMFRDDKSYPYICITAEERPRVFPTRTPIRDGSRYLGPYDHVGHMQRTLETIRTTFGLCTCAVSNRNVDRNRGLPKWRTCLGAYLGSCSAELPLDIHRDTIRKVERMLSGKTDALRRDLQAEMEIASQAMAFEDAARIRDSILSLDKFSQKMKLIEQPDVDRDLFVIERDDELGEACGVLFRIREGKLIGKIHRFIRNIDGSSDPALLQTFLEDYYTDQDAEAVPREIMLSHPLEDEEPLLAYLGQQLGRKVQMSVPKIGEKRELVAMALSNARFELGQRRLEKAVSEQGRIPASIQELQRILGLSRTPRRIECFDNSNIQGSDPVASMVCFVDAQPRKASYKKFTIKTVQGPDDFASMREVVGRRYRRLSAEGGQMPDLIVIDGGKGQLGAAVESLRDAGCLDAVEIIGLAKRLEEVFLPGQSDPIMIPKTSPALKLLQRVRDEAHRFAITYHRKKRSERTITTDLSAIPGVGPATARKLLSAFRSVQAVRAATPDMLRQVTGEKTAKAVYDWYHPER